MLHIDFTRKALVPASAASAQGSLKHKRNQTPKPIPGEREYKAAHKYFNENHFSYGMGELEQAAELGNLKAKQELGLMYQYGIGCEQSYPMAIKR